MSQTEVIEYMNDEDIEELYNYTYNANSPMIDVLHFIRKIQDELADKDIKSQLWIPAIGPKFIQPILKLEDVRFGIEGDIVMEIKDGFRITQSHFSDTATSYRDKDGEIKPISDYIHQLLNKVFIALYHTVPE